MAIVFKTPKSTLNTTSKAIQNLGSDCPPCPEPELQSVEIEYDRNGEYTVTPDEGYDGLSQVEITVDVPSDVNNQNKSVTISSNGESTISADSGYSGLGEVTVTVDVDPVLARTTITPTTSLQTIEAPQGYDGFEAVNVLGVDSNIDPNILSNNIKNGVTILGVTGSYTAQPNLQAKSVNPSTSAQTVSPDGGYDGLSQVAVSAVTSSIDANIAAGNIKDGVTILGVTGSYSGASINNQNKTVSPTTSQQSVSADAGYTGLGTVTVNAVTYEIDNNIQPANILSGVTILGVEGTDDGYQAGYAQGEISGYESGYGDGYAQGQSECPAPDLTTLNVTPTTSAQQITPSQEDGYDEVNVAAVTSAIDQNIVAGNIRDGVSILGVLGTYTGSGANVPDWSSIGWSNQDVTDSGIVADVAYTATVKDDNVWTNDKRLIYAPKQSNHNGSQIFANCSELVYVPDFTLTNDSFSTYTSMFSGCSSLESVGNITRVATANTNGGNMFFECLKLRKVGTIDMEGIINCKNMFSKSSSNFSAPFTAPILNNTSSVTNMQQMFGYGGNLTPESIAIISNYNTSAVTDMSGMFRNTYFTGPNGYPFYNTTLTTAPSFDTSSVTNMANMFGSDYSGVTGTLTTVPKWNCSSVYNVGYMFEEQNNLTTLGGFTGLGLAFNSGNSTGHILDLSASTVLTKASIMNVINEFGTVPSGVADATLKLSATSYALLDASDIAIATAKNWTVTSA